jgi:hypothetical protein
MIGGKLELLGQRRGIGWEKEVKGEGKERCRGCRLEKEAWWNVKDKKINGDWIFGNGEGDGREEAMREDTKIETNERELRKKNLRKRKAVKA